MNIFIAGNSRSGTTMMSRILDNHPEVHAFQELHFFDELCGDPLAVINRDEAMELFAKLCSIQTGGYFGNRDPQPYLKIARMHLNDNSYKATDVLRNFLDYETAHQRKIHPCEQTPQNIFYLDTIFAAFPSSKVIIMIRDPREVLLSQKNKWKRKFLTSNKFPLLESIRSKINYHPITISKIWNAVMRETEKHRHNPDVMLIQYEKLVEEPDKIVRHICSHIGIDFHPAMTDIPVVGSSNFNDAQQRGISKDKKGLFLNGLSSTEIDICQQITGDYMKRFGYEPVMINSNRLMKSYYKFSQPFRLGLSLLFNLKRLKNPKKLIKRFF